jgi:murein DD-endopeptidase MepM/ murein hydrolase activator NlpD
MEKQKITRRKKRPSVPRTAKTGSSVQAGRKSLPLGLSLRRGHKIETIDLPHFHTDLSSSFQVPLPAGAAEKDPVDTGLLKKAAETLHKNPRDRKIVKFFLDPPFYKNRRIWAFAGSAVAAAAAMLVLFQINSPGNLELSFHEDPVLQEHLLDYASPGKDYEGQGSGGMLPTASAVLPSVSLETYVIQKGDTLSAIAREYGLTVGTLIGYNSITDVYTIIPGTELQIPDIDGVPYQVQKGDSLASIADKYDTTLNALLDANDLETTQIHPGDNIFIPGGRISDYDYKKATGTLFVYPTSGRFTSGFGYRADPFTGARRFHYAIDLANREGTPIRASQGGTVISVLDRPTGYGKSIIIRHPNGYQTLYAHLSEFNIRQGQYVAQGQVIGKMGSTGRSTGPHLHFSIYRNNVPVDPLIYLH